MDQGQLNLQESAGAHQSPEALTQAVDAPRTPVAQDYPRRRARSSHRRSAGRWRGWLAGCGIVALITVPLFGAGWWYVSRHLGQLVSGLVRSKAGESLNGRLEFSRLEVDLAGRAVLTDAAVFVQGESEPVLTCPRTVVTLDFINFIGPNRGRRAVVADLYKPQARIVRNPDGGFNVTSLVKEPKKEEGPIGVSIHLHDAALDFTDACLLDQGYPLIHPGQGLGAQLLAELGYNVAGPGESLVHSERVALNGSVVVNGERKEVALDLIAQREQPGGVLSLKGTAKTDGTVFDLTVGMDGVELDSLRDYAHAVFPALVLGAAEPPAKPGAAAAAEKTGPQPASVRPYLAGLMRDGQITLSKHSGKEVSVSARLALAEVQYTSRLLPDLRFPSLNADYSAQRAGAEFKLNTLGCQITGNPSIDFQQNTLSGSITLAKTELARLLAALRDSSLGVRPTRKQDLPLTGSVSAKLELGGTLDLPEVTARLSSGRLGYGKLNLGTLGGTLNLAGDILSAKDVQLSGGEAPVKLAGSLDTSTQSGRFTLGTGPLSITEALDLASRLSSGAKPVKLDAHGMVSLSADAAINSGKVTSSLSLRSDRLVFAKQVFTGVDVSGSLTPQGLHIDQAVAAYTAAQPVKAAGFTSTGPLRLSLRAGGTISTPPGGAGMLALTGKASTHNLAPDQASVSFKISGPLKDPEIKLQLKTNQQAHPLALNATGHYRTGWAPLSATLTWYATKVDFAGKVDFAKELIAGKLTAAAVDLARFSGDKHLSGVLSATAQLSGTFKQPAASGRVDLPKLAYATPQRSYQLTGLTAGFKLIGMDTLSIADGKFSFEGNAFTIQGVLGKASKELTLACQRFNLLSVLALAETTGAGGKGRQLQVQSAGPLSVKISGDPQDPHAVITYSSGAGSVEGHAFDSAKLAATASLDGAQVSSFSITSPQGSITATGRMDFTRPGQAAPPPKKKAAGILGLLKPNKAAAQALPPKPGFGLASFSAQATVASFDAALLSALAGGTALSTLSGKLSGKLQVSGSGKQYSADGTLKLTGGRYQGVAVSEASADLQTTGKGIQISNGRVIAEGTTLTASGTIGNQPGDINLQAQAASLELALANPFLPKSVPQLKGPVRLDLKLSPGRGTMPAVDVTLADTGQAVFAGETRIDSLQAEASWREGALTLKKCQLGLQGSTFTASGTLGKELNQAKLTAQGSNIELALLAPFMPKGIPKLKGTVGLDLALSPSKGQYPNMDATVRDTGHGLSVGGVQFDSAQAQFALTGSELNIRQCQLAMNGSTLNAGGKLAVTGANGGKKDQPLNFWVKSKDFSLHSISPLLPPASRASLPDGTVTCDLQLTGKQSQPLLSGDAQFSLNKLPAAVPVAITGLSGDIGFAQNDFDIRRIDIKSSDQAGLGQAKISGSGRLSLSPIGLVSGSVDISLAPEGKYTQITFYDPQSASKKALFEGWLGGVLHITGSKDTQPVVAGQLVINGPGQVSLVRLGLGGSKQSQPTKSFISLKNLKVLIQAGTEIRIPPPFDLQATILPALRQAKPGELPVPVYLTLNGEPGNLDPKNPRALRIAGELSIPTGSIFFFGRTLRLDGQQSKLSFSDKPGDLIPYLTGSAAIILPHVLTGNEILTGGPQGGGSTQISAGQDLKVFILFDSNHLDYASGGLENIHLRSEPPLSEEAIRNYLLGGVEGVLTGQTDLSQFAEGEVLGYGTGFISRIIENKFDLAAFRLGGSGSAENPYYVQVEKEVSPQLSVTYFRNFFGQTGQQEEFGVKYNVFRSQFGSHYQNLDLRLNFQQGGAAGNEREFMFMWTTKF